MSTSTHSDKAFAALLNRAVGSTALATAAIEDAVAYVAAPNRRIVAMALQPLHEAIHCSDNAAFGVDFAISNPCPRAHIVAA